MKPELIFKLSAIVDKMQIADEIFKLDISTGDEEKDKKELGTKIVTTFLTKIYKAKEEVYDLICYNKSCSREEAESCDIIEEIKNILAVPGIKDFLA